MIASQVIGPGGGSVSVTDQSSPLAGTQVVVPAGALSRSTLITIGYGSGSTGIPGDVVIAEVGPPGMVFSIPVAVTMPYTAQYLATNGIMDPTTLKMVAINGATANETLRTIAQDTIQNTVTAQTTHTSNFGVLGYTLASLSGDYAMNFTMIDANTASPMPGQIAVDDAPPAPFSGVLTVPFPGYAFRDEQGSVTFDGAGNYSWSANRNIGGTPVAVGGAGTYTVDADGNMRLDFGIEGTVLAGGSTFVLAATQTAHVIEMGMGLKKGGTFGNGSLVGSYAVALYYSDATVGPVTIKFSVPTVPPTYTYSLPVPFPASGLSSELRTMLFDGAGNYTWSGTRNTSGISSPVSGSGTYTVASDGALTIDTGLTGHLLAGATTLLLTSPSEQVQMGAGLKKGGTFSTATLSGRYTVAYHYSDATGSPTINIGIPSIPYVNNSLSLPFPVYAFNSEVRTMTFDGMGGYIWTGKRDHGGVSNPNLQGSGTYAIDADGTLSMDNQVAGNVLEGGSTFILAPTGGPGVKIGVGVLK